MSKENQHIEDFGLKRGESGFTLIEMVIALVILFIVVMGVFSTFVYATKFNRGNSQRSQAVSVF